MNHTVIDIADAEAAHAAATAAVAAGEVIVLPTDTVYGVGAQATSGAAVQRLLDAKRRGRDFPPPVLVAEVGMVRALATGTDERLDGLAAAFWPGALTVVLNARPCGWTWGSGARPSRCGSPTTTSPVSCCAGRGPSR